MIWLCVGVLCSVGFIQTMRWTQHARGSVVLVGLINYAVAAAYFAAITVVRPPRAADWRVVLLGACTGALYVCTYYLMAAVIRRIGVGLTSAAMTLAVSVPVLVSIAYGDPWLDKAPGFAVAAIALPLVAFGGADLAGPTKPTGGPARLFWVLLIYLACGAENALFKIGERTGGAGFESAYLPALFITATVAALPPALLAGQELRAADGVRGVILGGFNVMANYALAMAVQQLDGPLVFPAKLNGIVLGTTLLGRILWKERLSRMAASGVALTLLSTVLLVGLGELIGRAAQ